MLTVIVDTASNEPASFDDGLITDPHDLWLRSIREGGEVQDFGPLTEPRRYAVKWLTGPRRERAWMRYGFSDRGTPPETRILRSFKCALGVLCDRPSALPIARRSTTGCSMLALCLRAATPGVGHRASCSQPWWWNGLPRKVLPSRSR